MQCTRNTDAVPSQYTNLGGKPAAIMSDENIFLDLGHGVPALLGIRSVSGDPVAAYEPILLAIADSMEWHSGAVTPSMASPTLTPTLSAHVQGTPLAYGDTVQGFVGGNFIEPYYFTAAAGDSVTITLSASAFTPYVDLFDMSGKRIAYNTGNNGQNAQISIVLNTAGIYSIQVRSYRVGGSGDYTLSLSRR